MFKPASGHVDIQLTLLALETDTGVIGLVVDDQYSLGFELRVFALEQFDEAIEVVRLLLHHKHELLVELEAGQVTRHGHDVEDLE
ncbi:hypothetical protein D9M69_653720 [compost metagenome]